VVGAFVVRAVSLSAFLVLVGVLIGVMPVGSTVTGPSGRVAVVDGDTIDVGGIRVRLHGIDAPEVSQTCETDEGVVWACGDWVRSELEMRIEGRNAICEAHGQDRYDRVIAICRVDGRDIAAALVRDGLAFAYRRYSLDYVADENAASHAGRGLWDGVIQSPEAYRRAKRRG